MQTHDLQKVKLPTHVHSVQQAPPVQVVARLLIVHVRQHFILCSGILCSCAQDHGAANVSWLWTLAYACCLCMHDPAS